MSTTTIAWTRGDDGSPGATSFRSAILRDMPTVPAPDVYAWFEEDRPPHHYTLMFTRGLAPAEVVRRLAAPNPVTGARPGASPDGANRVDVHDLGDWTLAVEGHGFEAYVATAVERLSIGTEVVMLTHNVMGHCRFRHVVNGETWTDFDAVDPSDRFGLHPDRLVNDMRRAGLDPHHDFDDLDDEEPLHRRSQTMALAESVTAIRLAPEIFDTAPALSATIRFAIGE